VTWRSFGT